MYIIVDGIDGTGKSQFCRDIVEMIRKEYPDRDVVLHTEPSGIIGAFIRDIFTGKHGDELPNHRVMTLLFQADREAAADLLLRATQGEIVVVSDRSYLSTWAYQGATEEQTTGSPVTYFTDKHAHAPFGVRPHLSLILDSPVSVALSRKRRETDLFEKAEFLEKVRERYLRIRGQDWGKSVVKHINTHRLQNEVLEEIFATVRDAFKYQPKSMFK